MMWLLIIAMTVVVVSVRFILGWFSLETALLHRLQGRLWSSHCRWLVSEWLIWCLILSMTRWGCQSRLDGKKVTWPRLRRNLVCMALVWVGGPPTEACWVFSSQVALSCFLCEGRSGLVQPVVSHVVTASKSLLVVLTTMGVVLVMWKRWMIKSASSGTERGRWCSCLLDWSSSSVSCTLRVCPHLRSHGFARLVLAGQGRVVFDDCLMVVVLVHRALSLGFKRGC